MNILSDGRALSSAAEHFLHTEGVAGSNPAARTSLRFERREKRGCRAEAVSVGGLRLAFVNHRSKLRLGKPVHRSVERRLPRRSAKHVGGPRPAIHRCAPSYDPASQF
jgi:hypothetical protein